MATNTSNWTTSIEIRYRNEFEVDIENQLAEIREEILLFLNNIQKITIQIGVETLELHSEKETTEEYESVLIKDKKWKVFSKDNILPTEYQDKSKNEQQSYNLKVAIQDDLSDNYKKLFNFFPTQLSISLPCIIHGTFELNSSRNHLNESKKNEYILKELVQLLKECSLYLAKHNIDWRPYKLLSPSSTVSDSKLIEAFYKELEFLKVTERIYPCINNEYNTLDNAIYYSDEFNDFWRKYFPDVLPELLMPLNKEVANSFKNNTFSHSLLVERIDALSKCDLKIPLRAELITQLSKIVTFKDDQERFSLLVNESGKVISKEDLTFTPVLRSEESFNIPKSVKVDFMKSELYDLLISKFESGFDKKEPKSRELQRNLKSVVNLQPYDSNNVIDKIITGTKDALKTISTNVDRIDCIKEMVSALYANFRNIDNRQDKLKNSVPLISKDENICSAEDLYLSKTYPSGKLTELIYDGMLKAKDYLAPVDYWLLSNSDPDSIESFFLWLGVNKYSKITQINLQNNWAQKEYIDFVFANGTVKPDNFEINRIQKDSFVSKIERFDEIKKLSINKIILFALKDVSIRKLLEANEEKINWYYVTWRPAILPSFSFPRFQFLRSNLFTKYILEEGGEDLNKLINEDFQIDFKFLEQYGINRTEVKSILIKLGARESFNEIPPQNIYEILKAIPDNDVSKKGKATQTIYKMALESLVKQESTFPVPDNIEYFSRIADKVEYQPRALVYYSDNSILPKKILNTLPLLNLPKRIGEDNVEKYFGVKSLREFKIQIDEQNLKFNVCDTELNRFFESIKPYLLAYRLESPNLKKRINDNETKRKEANTLKQCRIHIVTHCMYKFGDNEEIPIDEKEFINMGDTFYYKECSFLTVDELKKDSIFCDAFAEMMCIIFKVNDLNNDFRQILKNDIQDTIHLTNRDLDKEKVEEAFQLLGISRIEINFWKNVFSQKNKKLFEPIHNTEELKLKVYENLGVKIPEGYVNVDFEHFGNNESYELICLLCNVLNLTVKQVLPAGLYSYHKKEFIASIKDNEYKFKQNVWLVLKNKSSEQGTFIHILNNYNLNFINQLDSEIHSHNYDLKVDYLLIIKSHIYNHFKIDIDIPFFDITEVQNKYENILEKYNIEEVDIADDKIRSLFFFEGNTEQIEKYLVKQFGTEEKSSSENDDSKLIGELVNISLSKNDKILQVSSGHGNGSWVHSGISDKGKKRKGKKAELLAYETLVNKYGVENVKWVSGNSITPDKNDKLHYDIEYKSESGVWKYLEVKAISDNQFILSSSEKDKGISEPDKFEIALVNDTTIYMVKDIFNFNLGETFEYNSKFVAHAKDYVIFFDINNISI
jgi:hypothetical protein